MRAGLEHSPAFRWADVEDALDHGQSDQLRKWFQGKVVLLGTDYTGDSDRRNTPFFTLLSGAKWTTAGVEIHANTIETLLRGDFLQPAPQWVRIADVVGRKRR
ncbi:MAG: CHASE2 domain-containing protein [Acidobacteriota bacterium]